MNSLPSTVEFDISYCYGTPTESCDAHAAEDDDRPRVAIMQSHMHVNGLLLVVRLQVARQLRRKVAPAPWCCVALVGLLGTRLESSNFP